MSKNQKASGITNIISYDNSGNISFVSGSTTLMSVSSSGAVTLTNTMSGGVAVSASLSANSNLLEGTGSVGFSTTASLLAVSSSQQQISASLLNVIANYATTGSNSFRADQSITGSLVVSSTITAQTLVVQTVTSSIVYSSGSNLFGSALGDTQTFTGSIYQTGSIAAFAGSVGIGMTNPSYKLQVSSEMLATGYNLSNTGGSIQTIDAGAYITLLGATGVAATNAILLGTNGTEKIRITNSGSVGIGTTNPTAKLQVVPYNEAFADGIFVNQAASNQATIRFKSAHSADSDYRIGASILVNNAFEIYSVNASASRVVLTSSGSVGIGTTNPTYKFEVAGTSGTFTFSTNQTNYMILRGNVASGNFDINNEGASGGMRLYGSTIQFRIPGVDPAMTITSSGLVGIGTTDPTGVLSVQQSNVNSVTTMTVDNSATAPSSDGVQGTIFRLRSKIQDGAIRTTGAIASYAMRGTGAGINNGDLRFYTGQEGDTIERMRIDSYGRVTKPYQPAFNAGKNTNSSVSSGATVIFQLTTGNKFNIGGHYNASTGIFTAPVAGVYIFSASLIWMSLANGQDMHDSFWIYKNSSIVAYGLRRAEYEAGYTGNGGYFVDFANVLLSLAVGDTVKVVNNRTLDIHGNSEYSYFYGYLLG